MKYIQTYENFKPIKVNSDKPYKLKKNLPKSIKFLQRRIKSLRKRLDNDNGGNIMGTPKKGQRSRNDMNNDKNQKIKQLGHLTFKQLQQAAHLKTHDTNSLVKENVDNEQFKIGDWVWLKGVPYHLYDLVNGQPAEIESIKEMTRGRVKYTLTYSKGWQKSFIHNPGYSISEWIEKATPEESEKFREEKKIFNYKRDLKKSMKKYNL